MREKDKWNFLKAIVAVAVAMAFVMPVAAVANVGTIGVTSNIENTGDMKNIVEISTNGDEATTSDASDSIDADSVDVDTTEEVYTDTPIASTTTDDDINLYDRYTYYTDSTEYYTDSTDSGWYDEGGFSELDTASVVDTATYVDSSNTEVLPSTGRTIYVDDDADPSWYNETQVKTIQEGVNNATAGDTVYVYNGTYYELVTVNKQLDLVGEGRENVIVDGNGTGMVFYVNASDISMNNFTVTNGEYGIYLDSSSNSIFTNLWVIDNIGTYGFYATSSNSVQIISGNYSHNGNSADEEHGFNIYFVNSNAVTIDTVTVDDPVQGGSAMSCPFLYLWNGENYDYYTDLAGEPLGAPWFFPETYEAGIYELGDFASTDDVYKMKLRESIYECDFFDEAKLILVDVPEGYSVFNEWHITFSQQHVPPKDFMTIKDLRKPISAVDKYGNNVLSEVSEKDGVPLSTSYSDQNSVILDFGSIEHPEYAKLIITGWSAYHLNDFSTAQPYILLETLDGNEWKQSKTFGKLPGDSKTIVFDIAGILKEDNTKIRLTTDYTPAAIGIIDQVLLDDSEPVDITVTYLDPSYADLHWAGSTNYVYPTKDNRLSATDEQLPARRDALMYGNFTKYGNVLPLLDKTDDRFVIMRHGDEVSLEFNDIPLDESKDRYVFLYADVMYSIKYTVKGFVTDSIYPLPYHGMKTYPYPEDEWKYKDDPDYQEYLDTWNTRSYQHGSAYGIFLGGSDNAVINNVSGRATHEHPERGFDEYGIYLSDSHYATLTNVSGLTNWEYGIYLQSSSYSNIMECDIHNNEYGIYFSNSIGGNIENCNFYNTSVKPYYGDSFGIYLTSSSGTSIRNCRLYDNPGLIFGIYVFNSPSCNIIGCKIYNNVGGGIYTRNSPSCNIIGCEAYNNSAAPSIFLYDSPNSKLEDNIMYNNDYNFGITGPSSAYYQYIDSSNMINGKPIRYIIGQRDMTFDETDNIGYLGLIDCMNITAKNLDVSGVLVVLTTDSTISNISAHNAVNGIYLLDSLNNNILNCDTYDNMCGISADYSEDNDIINCVSHDNTDYGILLYYVFDSNIINCDVYNTSILYGIYISYSSYVNLMDCSIHDISGSRPGVRFQFAPNNNVMNCSFYNNSWNTQALDFEYSPDCNVTNCNLYDNEQGILFRYSPDCNVVDCQIYNNTVLPGIGSGGSGISIRDSSPNVNITNCDIYNNTHAGISAGRGSEGSTITNCDIYNNGEYRGGVTGGMGQAISIVQCSITITNCRLYDNTRGIFFVSAEPTCILRDNRIYNNAYNIGIPGTKLIHFDQDIDTSNTVDGKPIYYLVGESDRILDETDNIGYLGLVSCTNITVKNSDVCGMVIANTTDSTISNINTHDNQDGIYLWGSSNNDFVGCNIYDNYFAGSRIISSSGNSITNCNVYNNGRYGLWFQGTSNDNLIHHNNFVNNVDGNAIDQGTNTWDDGYPSGGNYYSDYSGFDNYSGPGQNISGSDGIGDTPYPIAFGSNQDNYPLMEPLLDAPELLLPADGSGTEDQTPTFDWTDIKPLYPVTYTLLVANDTGFTNIVIEETDLTESEYTPTEDMPADITYYWKVNASVGIYDTEWSETWSFFIGTDLTPPTTPDLIYPTDELTTVEPMIFFDWTDAYDAFGIDYYTLQVATDDAFNNIVAEETPTDSECALALATADDYYWRVQAVDNNGLLGDWSETWMFTRLVDTTPPTVELTYPVGGEDLRGTVEITWTATDDYTPSSVLLIDIDYRCEGDWQVMSSGEENDGTYTWDTTLYPDSEYYVIRVSTSDKWDNTGFAESYPSITVDNTAPVTTVDLYPADPDGENNWYIRSVHIALLATDEPGVLFATDEPFGFGVNYTMYRLNEGSWQEYDVPFTVTEDDEYTLEFYSVDYAGNEETAKSVNFKIDQTAPTINLTVEKTGLMKWLLTATVSDETSGVAKVEFYLNDELLGNVTESPYTWEVSEKGTAYAVVYDNAGNQATSDPVPVSVSQSQSQSSSNLVPVQRRISWICPGSLPGIQNTQRRV